MKACIALLISLYTASACALTADELFADCNQSEKNAQQRCEFYISGFIDGSLSTDPAVAQAVIADATELSDWMRRAMRNRVGTKMERMGSIVYASVCLPPDSSLHQITQTLLANATPPKSGEIARAWLYDNLRSVFPCQSN